jgi:small subunit ribosomal protein S3
MIEKKIIQDNINKLKLEEYLQSELDRANYSHIDFTQTSTSTKITIYSEKPGLVIGRGGHRVKEITQKLKDQYGIENPQVEAKEVEKPDLDAEVVVRNVKGWLEKGGHPKRVGNTYVHRVMEAGAVGVQIEIAGKLSGSRGRVEKFSRGYVKKCGETANQNVDYAYKQAVTQPGSLGVKVRIMKELPGYMTRQQVQKEELDLVEDEEELPEEPEDNEEKASSKNAEEESEEPVEETATDDDVDYEELSDNTIAEIKDLADDMGLDYEQLLEAEKANKDRKTLKSWLKAQIEE